VDACSPWTVGWQLLQQVSVQVASLSAHPAAAEQQQQHISLLDRGMALVTAAPTGELVALAEVSDE
jgi:hypothetical protein